MVNKPNSQSASNVQQWSMAMIVLENLSNINSKLLAIKFNVKTKRTHANVRFVNVTISQVFMRTLFFQIVPENALERSCPGTKLFPNVTVISARTHVLAAESWNIQYRTFWGNWDYKQECFHPKSPGSRATQNKTCCNNEKRTSSFALYAPDR